MAIKESGHNAMLQGVNECRFYRFSTRKFVWLPNNGSQPLCDLLKRNVNAKIFDHLVLPLKNEMKDQHKFQGTFGVLNLGMTVVTALLISVGFLGYLQWGDDVQGSLTLNLPPDNVWSLVVQGILALGIIFTYPIQFYVPVDIIWADIKEKYGPFEHPKTLELSLRVALVFVTFIFAEAIPNLGLFISLVGAISSTALALLFPPMIEMISRSQDAEGVPIIVIIKNSLILILGVLGFATGTYQSVRAIYNEYAS